MSGICAICLDDMGRDGIFKLECGHEYHTRCLVDWFRVKGTCPVCISEGLRSRSLRQRVEIYNFLSKVHSYVNFCDTVCEKLIDNAKTQNLDSSKGPSRKRKRKKLRFQEKKLYEELAIATVRDVLSPVISLSGETEIVYIEDQGSAQERRH